uniref:Phosphoserine aminotransferase putative n=1 Tax=Albugo laibachii Nc14 TaxID=890382 RepID=F0W4Q8_9STRA|nr:phosphoserine aminotransferase putative [Albugo laibachii Nc14]|eukprot:CCA16093.1 phosphoserine aminotransferase putative [Albugo laibachii Nc14]
MQALRAWTKRARYATGHKQSHRLLHTSRFFAMPNILCTDTMDPQFMDLLRSKGHHVTSTSSSELSIDPHNLLSECQVLLVDSHTKVSKEIFQNASKLRLLACPSSRLDKIDIVHAARNGVMVLQPDIHSDTVYAERTLSFSTRLSELPVQGTESMPHRHSTLHNKTIGIIGLGRVGRQVAARCRAVGMNVIGYDLILSNHISKSHQIEPVSLSELLSRSDYLSLHLPRNANTKQFLSAGRLESCKDGVKIINGIHSDLVDVTSLQKMLEKGKIGGIALQKPSQLELDVQESELYTSLAANPRVILAPELTTSMQTPQLAQAIDNVLSGRSFRNIVNAPNVDFFRKEEFSSFFLLAQKLGSIQAQLLDERRITRVIVVSVGQATASPQVSGQIIAGVLRGMLSFMLEEEVTPANARHLAENLGIKVVEHKHDEPIDSSFSNRLSVIVEGENGFMRKVTGTVFGKNQPRLIALNDLSVDCIPTGSMLMFQNQDQPGVLNSITSVLAKHDINIGCFGLARESKEAHAVGILNLDDPIPNQAIQELDALDQLSNLRPVTLLDMDLTARKEWSTLFRLRQQENTSSLTLKPALRPNNPNFGSGPCKKRPGYSLANLSDVALGRSHRSKLGKGLLEEAIHRTKHLLQLPDDYLVGIVPASDTGAFEMAMWNMLGARPVDICYWESFGKQWYTDAMQELKLNNVCEFSAPFGELPDLSQTNPDHDILFTWNGTTSGVCVPDGSWIADDRKGLTFNDATSAAFAMEIPWSKIDVCTFSWQKVLGGEGAHGVLILSPRAVERLETFVPSNRPIPKIFRLTNAKTGNLLHGIFKGSTINTPSMLCVEDYLDALQWAEGVGEMRGLIAISRGNLRVIEEFVQENSAWIAFLAQSPQIRSNTSVCLQIKDFTREQVHEMVGLLESEQIAYDIGSYRDAPPGLRIWCGATVETKDVEALLPWIKWAHLEVLARGSTT